MDDFHFKFNIKFSMRYLVCNMLIWKMSLDKGWILKGSIVILKKFRPAVKRVPFKKENSLFMLHFFQADHPSHHFCPSAMCNTDISGTCVLLWIITSHTANLRTSIQEYCSLNKHSCLSSNFEMLSIIATESRNSE